MLTKKYIKQHAKAPDHIKRQCREILMQLKNTDKLTDIIELEKMKGFKDFFRIRLANYRMGIEQKKPGVIIICVMERSQIYKNFPPKS